MSPNTSPISDGCEQPDLLTRIKEMNERLRLRRLGHALSGFGIAMMAVSAVLAITSIVYPHRWHLGTFVVPLRSFRGPIQICFIGFVVWYLAVEESSASYQFFRGGCCGSRTNSVFGNCNLSRLGGFGTGGSVCFSGLPSRPSWQ